jgi:hypothetical protein
MIKLSHHEENNHIYAVCLLIEPYIQGKESDD